MRAFRHASRSGCRLENSRSADGPRPQYVHKEGKVANSSALRRDFFDGGHLTRRRYTAAS
jgi:hypothetical protein